MTERGGIFAGDDPMTLASEWLAEAEEAEPEDANAMALATVDAAGMPNVRVVLLKEIEQGADGGFVFYTNFEGTKGREIEASGKASFVMHWKSLRRQIRARGTVERVGDDQADAYFASRGLESRLGAWASRQSRPLESREALMAEVERAAARFGDAPPRPPHWGGYRIRPLEIEFWADGASRLHDRFLWARPAETGPWNVERLNP
jgi:pyridoxamine 5'-phosphate oxidase